MIGRLVPLLLVLLLALPASAERVFWRLTSDVTSTTSDSGSASAIPEWTWTAAANTKYSVVCSLMTQAFNNTVGVRLKYNGPASPALFIAQRRPMNTHSVGVGQTVTAYGTDGVLSSGGSARIERLHMLIETTDGGDFTIAVFSEIDTREATVLGGTSCVRRTF